MIVMKRKEQNNEIHIYDIRLDEDHIMELLKKIKEAKKEKKEIIIRLDDPYNRNKLVNFQFHRMGVKIEDME